MAAITAATTTLAAYLTPSCVMERKTAPMDPMKISAVRTGTWDHVLHNRANSYIVNGYLLILFGLNKCFLAIHIYILFLNFHLNYGTKL